MAASAATTTTTGKREDMPFIPDIGSTSLGLEDDADDPKKWQKFAWKYAGSLVVFAIAYTTIGWYADEKERERKRHEGDDEEEEKAAVNSEQEADTTTTTTVNGSNNSDNGIPGLVSELDELNKLRDELRAALDVAKSAQRRDELREEMRELDVEIDHLLLAAAR